MINTDCQGTSGGIIFISLTGGREGKIISKISPIYVYVGLFVEWKIQGNLFKTILDSDGFVESTPIIKSGVIHSGIGILNEGENFYFDWYEFIHGHYAWITVNKGVRGTNQQTQLFSTPRNGEWSVNGDPPYYYRADIYAGYEYVMAAEEIDGIAIWNDQEILYTRRNYGCQG